MKILDNLKKESVIVSAILGIIVLMFFFLFIIKPLLAKFMRLSEEERVLFARMKKARTLSTDKEKLLREVNEIEARINYYENRLPSDTDIPNVLEELIKLSKKNDITFISIEPQEIQKILIDEQEGTSFLEIPISLSLKAGYHEFAKFINDAESSNRFMAVNNIKVTNDVNYIEKHNIKLTISAFALAGKEDE